MGGAPLRGGLRERKPLPLAHPHPPVSGAADRPDTQGMGPGGRCPGREEQGIQTAEITRECAGGSAGRARGRGQRAPGTHCASQAARDLDSEASEAGRSGPQRPGAGAAAGSADSSAASRARGAARARPPLCREVRARAAAPSLRNFPVPPPPPLAPSSLPGRWPRKPPPARRGPRAEPRDYAPCPAPRGWGTRNPAQQLGPGGRGPRPAFGAGAPGPPGGRERCGIQAAPPAPRPEERSGGRSRAAHATLVVVLGASWECRAAGNS